MNQDPQPDYREQLEIRIVAQLLGEASPFETAELERALATDPALAEFKHRMERTIGLVREASKKFTAVSPDVPEQPRLSTERRQALLRRFRQPAVVSFPNVPSARRQRRWLIPVSLATGFVILAGAWFALIPRFGLIPIQMKSRLAARQEPTATFLHNEPAREEAAARETTDGEHLLGLRLSEQEGIETEGRKSRSYGYGISADSAVKGAPAAMATATTPSTHGGDSSRQTVYLPQRNLGRSAGRQAEVQASWGDFNNDGSMDAVGSATGIPRSGTLPGGLGGFGGGASATAPGQMAGGRLFMNQGGPVPLGTLDVGQRIEPMVRGRVAAGQPREPMPSAIGVPTLDQTFHSAKTDSAALFDNISGPLQPVLGDAVIPPVSLETSLQRTPAVTDAFNLSKPESLGKRYFNLDEGLKERVGEATTRFYRTEPARAASTPAAAAGSFATMEKERVPAIQEARSPAPTDRPAPQPQTNQGTVYSVKAVGYIAGIPIHDKKKASELKVAEAQAQGAVERYEDADEDTASRKIQAPAAATPQPEINTQENPVSTFSLNVSDVSFKMAAASLASGVMPEPGAIRVEEFVNAFHYHDPAPAPRARLAFAWERARYPFAHNRDVLRFAIQTAAQGRESGKPLNLVVLLDNSGSMERPDRVQIVREALKILAHQLRPEDRISVVAFARTARLWVDGMAGGHPEEFLETVLHLNPQGGTNLEDALALAYATAIRHFRADGMNRVILLTDGAANLGNVEPEILKQSVVAHRVKGIALDCFGIGWEGYNDDLLEVLARNSNGRYGFLNQPEQAGPDFVDLLAGALHVAASDVKAQVQFNPQRVLRYRQVGYAKHQLTKEQFRDNTVDAAEIAAAESGNALYLIETLAQGTGPIGVVRVRYQQADTGEYVEQAWSIPYQGQVPALDQASPAMRLAAIAAAFGEWLSRSPYADQVALDALSSLLAGVPEAFEPDPRPPQLASMIQQAKSIAGK